MIRLDIKSQAEIAELFNVDRSTISRMMKEVREKELVPGRLGRNAILRSSERLKTRKLSRSKCGGAFRWPPLRRQQRWSGSRGRTYR
jgi:transposase